MADTISNKIWFKCVPGGIFDDGLGFGSVNDLAASMQISVT